MTRKVILLVAMAILPSLTLYAQSNGSNSSYSRFGLGTMAEQSQTYNRGMGGVAMGLRSGSRINMQNPASYSSIDSLSFIFDVGMSLQYGHLADKNSSVNVRNTSLTNVNAGFRVARGLGMSFGFVPFSTIGYSFQNEGKVGNDFTTMQPITKKTVYSGDGGIHQIYLGAGWNPIAKLSVGANISYLWGEYNHSMTQNFYENGVAGTNYNSQSNTYSASIHSYKLDAGIQYPVRLTSADWLTFGATYSLGHSLGSDATMNRFTSANDTVSRTAKDAFSIPHTFGGGLCWTHAGMLTLAADVSYEQWEGCKVPMAGRTAGDDISYNASTDQFLNRTQYRLGAEYVPNPLSHNKYAQTIKYSLGLNYSTPYIKVNGAEGPKEYRVTAGVGLPLQTRRMSGRSVINVSAEWMMRKPSAKNLITENYVLLNIGVTFNERWFMKWKIE